MAAIAKVSKFAYWLAAIPATHKSRCLLALLAGAVVLATVKERTISLPLEAGVGQAGGMVGAAVGTTLFVSLGLIGLLLPLRALIPITVAVGSVVVAAVVAAGCVAPDNTSGIVRFSEAAMVAMPVALLTLLALQVAAEARRGNVRSVLRAVTFNWGWLVLLTGMLTTTAIYVRASRRILFWDYAYYWSLVDAQSSVIRQGQWWRFARDVVYSVGDPYSLVPAALPALVVAPLPGHSLLGYALAVTACYLVPALLAVGVLGLALARTGASGMDELSWQEGVRLSTLGAVAVLLLLPHFLQVVLRFNMLDVGGVALTALLAFAWLRMLRVLLGPPKADGDVRHAWRVLAAAVSVAALSVLCLMFRRWYIFDVLGFCGGGPVLFVSLRLLSQSGWRVLRPHITTCAALITAIATASPVLVQWGLQWRTATDAEAYAPWREDWAYTFAQFRWNFGLLLPALCGLLAVFLLLYGRQRALLLMLVFGTFVAVIGFNQIQAPGPQHFYLLMPLFGGLVAAGSILLARQIGSKLTLIILFASGAFFGLAPRLHDGAIAMTQPGGVDLWPVRETDVDELAQLAHWLDANLGPAERYCVIASGVTVNSSRLGELHGRLIRPYWWQWRPTFVPCNYLKLIPYTGRQQRRLNSAS